MRWQSASARAFVDEGAASLHGDDEAALAEDFHRLADRVVGHPVLRGHIPFRGQAGAGLQLPRQFFAEWIFGPERAALLAIAIPATAAADAAQRQKKTAALRQRLRKIDAAENAHAREIENLAHLANPNAAAITALRTRIISRFTELEEERAAGAELDTLTRQDTDAPDPDLLDALPKLGDILTGAPARLQQQLYHAFDLQMLYGKEDHQVSIYAAITPATPAIIAAILADSGSPENGTTTPEPDSTRIPVSDSARTPMAPLFDRDHGQPRREPARWGRRAWPTGTPAAIARRPGPGWPGCWTQPQRRADWRGFAHVLGTQCRATPRTGPRALIISWNALGSFDCEHRPLALRRSTARTRLV